MSGYSKLSNDNIHELPLDISEPTIVSVHRTSSSHTTKIYDPITHHTPLPNYKSPLTGYEQLLVDNDVLRKENAAMKDQLATHQSAAVMLKAQLVLLQSAAFTVENQQQPQVTQAVKTSTSCAQQDTTGPQEYEFLYIPLTRRLTRAEIRSRLRTVGVDIVRVLDIIYPARQVIGLLVNVQYLPLLRETLLKLEISPLNSFDPLDEKHIADPKHASLTTEDRCRLAADLHTERLLCGLDKMPRRTRSAVARSYVEIGWMTEADVHSF